VLCSDVVACSLATDADPVLYEPGVCPCFNAELGCAQVAIFFQIAFVETDGESCASGQKVAASGCPLREFCECGCAFRAGEPGHSGVPSHEPGYLGGQDAIVVGFCHSVNIEHKFDCRSSLG
jgi:hypothetical protein